MSSNRTKRGSGAPRRGAVPDVLGASGRVQILADLVAQVQGQRFGYEATRIANGHQLDDPVAGMVATREDGTVQSYRLLMAECDERIQRLRETYPDAWRAVTRLVSERDQA